MRLGLNLVYLHDRLAGVRVYGTELAKELAVLALESGHDVTFFVPRAQRLRFVDFLAGLPIRCRSRANVVAFDLEPARKLTLLFYEQVALPIRAHWLGISDLYSFDYRSPYLFLGRKYGTILDMNFRDRPENFTRVQRAIRAVSVALTLKLCRTVCTMSEFSGHRIRDAYQWYTKPLVVVPAGVGDDTNRRKAGDVPALHNSRFILSVGTISKHKNYARLIEAFAILAHPTLKLIIAGKVGNGFPEVEAAIVRNRIGDRVIVTGHVDSATLDELYRRAELFVTASDYEGFGITVLEAMQRRIPVACSRSAALPEVVGEAAILFDPESVVSIRDALAEGIGSEATRVRLSERGCERVRHYSWGAAARRAMQALAEP